MGVVKASVVHLRRIASVTAMDTALRVEIAVMTFWTCAITYVYAHDVVFSSNPSFVYSRSVAPLSYGTYCMAICATRHTSWPAETATSVSRQLGDHPIVKLSQ